MIRSALLRTLLRSTIGVALGAALVVSGSTAALADDAPVAEQGEADAVADAQAAQDDDEPQQPGADEEEPAAPASVSGTVRLQAPGVSAAGVTITALEAISREVVTEVVTADGSYALELPAGSYVLWYVPATGSNALDVYSGGSRVADEAQTLTVDVAESLRLDDVVLPLAAVVAGDAVVQGDARVGGVLSVSAAASS